MVERFVSFLQINNDNHYSILLETVHKQPGVKYDKNKDSWNYGNIVLYSAEQQKYDANINYQRMRERLKEKQVSSIVSVRPSKYSFFYLIRRITRRTCYWNFSKSIMVWGGTMTRSLNITMEMCTLQLTITLITTINQIKSKPMISKTKSPMFYLKVKLYLSIFANILSFFLTNRNYRSI